MNSEINLDSGKHQHTQSNMTENGVQTHDIRLVKMQLENEQRYKIGDFSLDEEEILLDLNTASQREIESFLDTAMINDFNNLILPYKNKLQQLLTEKWENSRPKNWYDLQPNQHTSNESWNTVMHWDRKIRCPTKGCGNHILKTPASNDRILWLKTRSLLVKLVGKETLFGSIGNQDFGRDSSKIQIFSLKHKSIDVNALRRIINDKYDFISTTIDSKFTEKELKEMHRHDIDFYNAMIHINLCLGPLHSCKKCGCDLFGYTPSISEKGDKFFESIADLVIRKIVSTIAGSVITMTNDTFYATIKDFELPKQMPLTTEIKDSVGNLLEKINQLNALRNDLKKSNNGKSSQEYSRLDSLTSQVKSLQQQLMKSLLEGHFDVYLKELESFNKSISEHCPAFIQEVRNRIDGKISFHAGTISDYNFENSRHSGILSSIIQHGLNFGDVSLDEINHKEILIRQVETGDNQKYSNYLGNRLQSPIAKVIDGVASELAKLKPLAFFTSRDIEYPAALQTKWAKKVAIQLLYLVREIEDFIIFQKVGKEDLNSVSETHKHQTWLIKFSKSFQSEFDGKFHQDEVSQAPKNDFDVMRFEPMLCPPADRTESLLDGGYLSESVRRRCQLISNNLPEHNFNITRFNPSKKAIASINKLQNTSWRVNEDVLPIIYQCLSEEVGKFFSLLEFGSKHDKNVLSYTGDFPLFDGQQLEEWMDTIDIASWMVREEEVERFWHAWQFDWRGRMYTCSNLLSPQGDDLARGLLLFGESLPINDNGWKWLNRMIGRAYRGRELDTQLGFNSEDLEVWSDIQNRLKSKKWSDIDLIFEQENQRMLLERVVNIIALNPTSTKSIWAKGDIFVKKCEGFQRLALTLEYNRLIHEKRAKLNEYVYTSIPLVVDASSNIYQHASRLTGKSNMAESVNVLPNEDLAPMDVYTKVAEKVSNEIKTNQIFDDLNLDEESTNLIRQFCNSRKFTAKGPVMTIGYGATDRSIMSKFLTHNGEDDGIVEWIYLDVKENKFVDKNHYFRMRRQMVDLPIKQLEQGKGEYKTKKAIKDNFKLNYRAKMAAHPMSKFGRAIAGEGGKFLRENKEHHQDIVQRVSKLFLDAIKVVLEGHSVLKDSLERVRKMNSLLIESSKNYTSWATVDGYTISNIRFENNISEPVKPWKRGMTSDRDENNNSPGNITFSSHIPSSTRNGDKEATGLPPNFVHSIDACHMRLFIDKMSKNTNNFWSA